MAAKIISMINMKGGVGKTTSTINLAADLAKYYNYRVLVIDLDPQTNATYCLMNPNKWSDWCKQNGTLWDVLNITSDFSIDGDQVDINNCIVKDVRKKIPNLDLLPSHLKCVNLDSVLANHPNSHSILSRRLDRIKEQYDLIICDCPPNVSKVTQNGIYASDYYLIPIEPDFLASIGAGILNSRVKHLKELMDTDIELFGVLFTKVRGTENQMKRMMIKLSSLFHGKVFDTIIRKRVDFSKATEKSKPICEYRPSSDAAKISLKFAKEFYERLEEA